MKLTIVLGICALLTPALASGQCEGISVVEDGVFVTITHEVSYNCAVYFMNHQVELDGATLHVTEVGVADGWADCYCPYRSVLIVGGLAAGDYTLVYQYGEMVENEEPPVWTWCEMPFTVGSATAENDELMVMTQSSGCGIVTTAIPDGPITVSGTWTAIKALYD